jgi:DnaJ-class molecular chaperone
MNIYDAAKILGLSGEVTPDIIRTAYLAACKKYHPDINPAGADMMKVVNAAYTALRDFAGNVKEQQADYGDLLNEALNAILGLSALALKSAGLGFG